MTQKAKIRKCAEAIHLASARAAFQKQGPSSLSIGQGMEILEKYFGDKRRKASPTKRTITYTKPGRNL